MRIRMVGTMAAIVAVSLALPVLSQAPVAKAPRIRTANPPRQQTPFTAEFKVTRVRTLANGATITREWAEVRAVDSQGRIMTSTTNTSPSGQEQTSVNVFDPVAGTRSSWNVPGQQATLTQMPAPGMARPSCVGNSPVRIPPVTLNRQTTTEDLGIQTIDGVEARGRKTTTTTPAGMIGNNEPLVQTHEVWVATAIGPSTLAVREINDDPDSGKLTRELTNLTLSEPAPSTFQPPEGYEIVAGNAPQTNCPATPPAPATPPPAQ